MLVSSPDLVFKRLPREKRKAGDETRTRDIFLGKEVLYQLSYTRAEMKDSYLAPA